MQAKLFLRGLLFLIVIMAMGCSGSQCSPKGVQVPLFDGKTFSG